MAPSSLNSDVNAFDRLNHFRRTSINSPLCQAWTLLSHRLKVALHSSTPTRCNRSEKTNLSAWQLRSEHTTNGQRLMMPSCIKRQQQIGFGAVPSKSIRWCCRNSCSGSRNRSAPLARRKYCMRANPRVQRTRRETLLLVCGTDLIAPRPRI
jgi:hypothetical protein